MPTFARGEHPCGRERFSAFGLFFANRVFQDLMIKFTAARFLWVLPTRSDWPGGHLVASYGLVRAQLVVLAAPMSLNSGRKMCDGPLAVVINFGLLIRSACLWRAPIKAKKNS